MDVCRIVAQHRDAYRISTPAGERNGVLAGRLRHETSRHSDLPAVGDFVGIRLSEGDGPAVIDAVLPRRTVLMRRAAGERPDDQVIAANIDIVFVVLGLDHDFNVRRVERYLAAVWEGGAVPVVLLNKSDLCDDVETKLDELRGVAIGVDAHVLSALNAEGLDAIDAYLKDGVTIGFVGSSGVGKSTLLNRLLGREAQATNDVREHDSRGRHTTTHRQLFVLPGGASVIDTPGMREFRLSLGLSDAEGGVDGVFADIEALAAQCRFADCAHGDEPGCAVREQIDPHRLASYHKLLRELRYEESRGDPAAAAERKRRDREGAKAVRQAKAIKGRQ
jgi:ribosome biogenesis GTPase